MNNRTDFDVIIIGAGPSGIFCAYELIKERPSLNILMVEKGRPIEKRVCPKRTTKVCVGCRPCSITTGFAGAGAFSDGKLSLSPDVGGNLPDILGYDKALELIHESDDIYLKFGADTCLLYTSGLRSSRPAETMQSAKAGSPVKDTGLPGLAVSMKKDRSVPMRSGTGTSTYHFFSYRVHPLWPASPPSRSNISLAFSIMGPQSLFLFRLSW